jgi:hypothetical protein
MEMAHQPLFFSFGSHTAISPPNSTFKRILNLLYQTLWHLWPVQQIYKKNNNNNNNYVALLPK